MHLEEKHHSREGVHKGPPVPSLRSWSLRAPDARARTSGAPNIPGSSGVSESGGPGDRMRARQSEQPAYTATEPVLQGLIGKLYALEYVKLFGPRWFLALLCGAVLSRLWTSSCHSG